MSTTKHIQWADFSDDEDDNDNIPDLLPKIESISPVLSTISTTESITEHEIKQVLLINDLVKYKRCPLFDTINGCPHQNDQCSVCPISNGIHPSRICANGKNCKYVIYDTAGSLKKIICTFLHPEIKHIKYKICHFHELHKCNFNEKSCHNIHIPHNIPHYQRNIFKKLIN